ncbi:NUDIX hydrolase [Halobaculum sp. EA56]|uniref:NUDIX hydrolase n=1 Tax=Halobaculum sp. EA56 TaxID=3421648 RepID=UPI003EBEE3A3
MTEDPGRVSGGDRGRDDDRGDLDPRDPRREYDDLIVNRVDAERPAAELRALRAGNEAIREGWVAVGLTLDPMGRVLVVDQADRGVAVPGGTALPGEPLADAVEREVCEETGVDVEAVRPHAVHDETIRAGDGSVPATPFRVVHFEARTARPTTPDDLASLGDDDETVRAVEWREELPPDVFGGDLVERVYDRIR